MQLYSGFKCTRSFPFEGHGMHPNQPFTGHHVTLLVKLYAHAVFLQSEHTLFVDEVHLTCSHCLPTPHVGEQVAHAVCPLAAA